MARFLWRPSGLFFFTCCCIVWGLNQSHVNHMNQNSMGLSTLSLNVRVGFNLNDLWLLWACVLPLVGFVSIWWRRRWRSSVVCNREWMQVSKDGLKQWLWDRTKLKRRMSNDIMKPSKWSFIYTIYFWWNFKIVNARHLRRFEHNWRMVSWLLYWLISLGLMTDYVHISLIHMKKFDLRHKTNALSNPLTLF